MKGKIFLFLILLLFPVVVNAEGNNISEEFQTNLYTAKIIEVIEEKRYDETIVQTLEIKITNGDYKGDTEIITNTLAGTEYDIKLKAGDNINVSLIKEENSFYFHSYEKSNSIILLLILFCLLVIVIGKLKGVKALISLIITIALIIFGLVPLLLEGYNPVILSIITCVLATVFTFLITTGFSKKTLIAIIGVAGGLIAAGLIAFIFMNLMHLTGVAGESEQMLFYLPGDITFDFKGLLFAGIIIGALGACMDVAMELTSSLTEIKLHNPKISDKKLINSGFNIGKDIMGTMVNTLILAYTGSSLSTILLFVGFNKGLTEIVNLESIATELIRALAGSTGLLLAIPITIFVFVLLNKKRKDVSNEKENN